MNKGIFLKLFFMVTALAIVVCMLITAARSNFSSSATGLDQPKTYFEQFFMAGGPVVWFVLLPMSIITVYLTTEYCLVIRRKKLLPDNVSGQIVNDLRHKGIWQLSSLLENRNDFVSVAFSGAIKKCGGDLGRIRNLVIESLQEQGLALLRRIEWTNIIGNVSPMIGLFGTVLGIIKMFNAMAMIGGQPHPSQLAGGISVALVTTLWGLMIAIPALTIHGVFQNRIEILASEAAQEAEKLLTQMAQVLKEQNRNELQKTPKQIVEIPSRQNGTARTPISPV